MTENTYHNLKPLKDALQQMGFSTLQEYYDHMSQYENSERIKMIEQEKDEARRMLMISAARYLGMGPNGRGI